MSFYRYFIRPLLFRMDPEKAHEFAVNWLKKPGVSSLLGNPQKDPKQGKKVFGLEFPNSVGLAAGFDKDARFYKEMGKLGFGFVEVGTVTPKPQPGNPKPRLFRLKKDKALINRMGFNNEGVEAMVERLKKRPKNGPVIGGNIGKNKDTPNEKAVDDYLICLEALHPYVDYFVINVSSPNTPGLRDLQEKEPLKAILTRLMEANRAQGTPKPILLKIAPDLTLEQLDEIVEIVQETQLNGIIATNTTTARIGLETPHEKVEELGSGGLSGKPLEGRSSEVIRYLAKKSNGKIPIIGVGGISSPEDARHKIRAGASLVQLYTGFIYEGPGLVKRIIRELR